mmetsp:Transcript_27972/g.70773  ORF Transcript_27972/g.70773 Transcript_27972/m.70773 type:complete len:200 (-) Transcript_27972:386-985(-)
MPLSVNRFCPRRRCFIFVAGSSASTSSLPGGSLFLPPRALVFPDSALPAASAPLLPPAEAPPPGPPPTPVEELDFSINTGTSLKIAFSYAIRSLSLISSPSKFTLVASTPSSSFFRSKTIDLGTFGTVPRFSQLRKYVATERLLTCCAFRGKVFLLSPGRCELNRDCGILFRYSASESFWLLRKYALNSFFRRTFSASM